MSRGIFHWSQINGMFCVINLTILQVNGFYLVSLTGCREPNWYADGQKLKVHRIHPFRSFRLAMVLFIINEKGKKIQFIVLPLAVQNRFSNIFFLYVLMIFVIIFFSFSLYFGQFSMFEICRHSLRTTKMCESFESAHASAEQKPKSKCSLFALMLSPFIYAQFENRVNLLHTKKNPNAILIIALMPYMPPKKNKQWIELKLIIE